MSTKKFTLAIHAGAIDLDRKNFPLELENEFKLGLKIALKQGYEILKNGGIHLDAVQASLISMENNPIFNAGKGGKVNQKFKVELDASIMDGSNLKCGAVASVQHIKNPIKAARNVMEKTRHVLLVGSEADNFAKKQKLEMVPNEYFKTKEMINEYYEAKSNKLKIIPQHETTGAIALDKYGNLAAGTSTGGITYKMGGRVGDSPIIGAGTYANNDACAVSCTGIGENMIRHSVAFDLRAKMIYKNITLKQAGDEIMEYLEEKTGGFISIDNKGNVNMPFNSPGMARAYVDENGMAHIHLFKDGEDYTNIIYNLE